MGLKVDRSTYRVTVTIDVPSDNKNGVFTTHDVVNYSVIRMPIIKPCPISIITMDIPNRHYLQLLKRLGKNEYPKCDVLVESGDQKSQDPTNARRFNQKFLTNKNNYLIINLQLLDNPSDKRDLTRVKIIMVETVFHWLWHTNGLNKVLQMKTAYDAINEYDGYLFSEFGGGDTFDPVKHIGIKPSSQVYRRLQLKSANDLILPTHIIMNYKPTDTMTYYFLDSFRTLGEAKKRILRMFVSLDDYNAFEPFDVTQNGNEDAAIGLSLSIKTLNDSDDRFQKNGDYAKVHRDWRSRYKQYVPTSTVSVPKYISSEDSAEHSLPASGGRGGPMVKYHPITSSPSAETKVHKEGLTIYSPDHLDAGEGRYNSMKSFLRDKVQGTIPFLFQQIQPNSIEFQRKYNLDLKDPSDYSFIPIGIVNEFTKLNMKEANYGHSAFVKFLKYN